MFSIKTNRKEKKSRGRKPHINPKKRHEMPSGYLTLYFLFGLEIFCFFVRSFCLFFIISTVHCFRQQIFNSQRTDYIVHSTNIEHYMNLIHFYLCRTEKKRKFVSTYWSIEDLNVIHFSLEISDQNRLSMKFQIVSINIHLFYHK